MNEKNSELVKICEDRQIVKSQSEQPSTSNDKFKIKKHIVLDEDEYREKLDKIIGRDFFPDVDKLRFDLEYTEAIENNDFAKIAELNNLRESMIQSGQATPGGFETPSIREQYLKKKSNQKSIQTADKNDAGDLSLSKFLNKFTSEDNAALEQILKADESKREEKMKFMTKDGSENNSTVDKMIDLPSIDEQRKLKNGLGNNENRSVTWKYKDRNNVMFVPEDAPLTKNEIEEKISSKPIIMHENTRFKKPTTIVKTNSTATSSSSNSQLNSSGKIGLDGNVISDGSTPQVGGFKFVPGTPFIDPNHLDTPNQMTWGTIDATPMRIEDGNATPRSGAFFKIPEIAKREILEQELHEKVLSKKRKTSTSIPSSSKNSSANNNSAYDRLSTMSPAAQRLASTTLRIGSSNDRSLQASYSTFSNKNSSSTISSTPSPFGYNRPSRTPTPKHDRNDSKR